MERFSISFTLGKASEQHGANIEHNNRKFSAANVNESLSFKNMIYTQQPKARTTMLCYATACVILQTAIFRNAYDSFAHFSFQFGTLLALIPLHLYDEHRSKLKKKRLNRWSFYVYYPAHMLLLVLIRKAI